MMTGAQNPTTAIASAPTVVASSTPSVVTAKDTASARTDGPLGRRPALNGLRGIRAVLVIFGHMQIIEGGSIDMFFVLTAFLITALFIEEFKVSGTVNFKRFYMRRGLRLLPAVCVFLAVVSLHHLLIGPPSAAVYTTKIDDWIRSSDETFRWSYVTSVLFYYSNWLPGLFGTRLGIVSHCWTLSLDEQFYVFWPLSLYFILKNGWSKRSIVMLLVGAALATAALRIWLARDGTFESYYRILYRTDTHLDSLAMGALGAFLAKWDMLPKGRWLRNIGWAAAAFMILECAVGGPYKPWLIRGGATLFAFATSCLIFALAYDGPPRLKRFFEARILQFCGDIAYSIYIWHTFVIRLVLRHRPESMGDRIPIVLYPIAIALIFVVSAMSYYMIEMPFLKIKDRFAATRSRPRGGTIAGDSAVPMLASVGASPAETAPTA